MCLLGDGSVHLLGSCFHLHVALSYSLKSQNIHTLTMTTLQVHRNSGPNSMLSEVLGLAAAKLLKISSKHGSHTNSDMVLTVNMYC